MKKRGISLIVLIVTIIVIIILAAVVILTLSKNNPIESAKEARFKEDVRTFQDELAMYIAKDYTTKSGQRDDKINATNYKPAGDPESVYTYIPSFSKKYEGKFVIRNDELKYEESVAGKELEWCNSLKIKSNIKTAAQKVEEDVRKYYGKTVKYSSNGISDWKIFYSDEENVYLISSEYVDVSKLPLKNDKKPENTNTGCPKAAQLTNILSEYTGTDNITDERIKKLNYEYFKKNNFTSNNLNMKAVAYMLDIEIWKDFAEGEGAEYAIGGPTIEMVIKSYCNKYPNNKYEFKAINNIGYQISKNGGNNWDNQYADMLDKTDTQFVLPARSKANAVWLASPCALGNNKIMRIYCNGEIPEGSVNSAAIAYGDVGFRPIVCLNSNVILKDGTNGYDFDISL